MRETSHTFVGVMALGLLVAGVVVFGPALQSPWQWDDKTLIRESPVLGHPELLGTALRQDFWAISANPRAVGMYRPVVTATYFADRALFGTSPVGPHAVNVVLHLLVCALLALLAFRLGSSPLEALLAAALFGFHPAVVEAVANISSRGDLLCAAFLLSAFLVLRRPGAAALVGAAGFVALAQLSKEAAMVGLPLALGLEWWAAGFRVDLRRWGAVSLSLGLVTASILALRQAVLGSPVRFSSPDGWTPVLSGAAGALRYAGRVLWPDPLVPYQPPTQASGWAVAGVILLLALAVVAVRRAPPLAFAVGWFLIATGPVAGWLPFPVRFSGLLLYLPLLGLALAASRGLSHVRAPIRWFMPLAGAVMSALLVQVWSSDLSLWQANVAAWPTLARPQLNLANALSARGETQSAREAYLTTVTAALAEGDDNSRAFAELGLGNLLLPENPTQAQGHFRRAAEASGYGLWQASLNLAIALQRVGREAEAAEVLEQQWAREPTGAIGQAGLDLARSRQDAAAGARWESRMGTDRP